MDDRQQELCSGTRWVRIEPHLNGNMRDLWDKWQCKLAEGISVVYDHVRKYESHEKAMKSAPDAGVLQESLKKLNAVLPVLDKAVAEVDHIFSELEGTWQSVEDSLGPGKKL